MEETTRLSSQSGLIVSGSWGFGGTYRLSPYAKLHPVLGLGRAYRWGFPKVRGPTTDPDSHALVVSTPTKRTPQLMEAAS